MSKVTFLPRSGKDLFNFMERCLIDTKTATYWAIEEFTLIDGKPLSVIDVANLSDVAYLMISSKIFPMNDTRVTEDNQGVHFDNICIKSKRIHRDFITELQTNIQKYGKNQTGLLKNCLITFYEISIEELEKMPFQVAAYLINKVNFFLSELATPKDELNINDIWVNESGKLASGKLDNLV